MLWLIRRTVYMTYTIGYMEKNQSMPYYDARSK